MNIKTAIIFILMTLAFSCKFKEKPNNEKSTTKESGQIYKNDNLTSLLNQNKQFFKDSLLKDNSGVIGNYFSNYQSDTCGIFTHKNSDLKEEFEGIKVLKGIRTYKKEDTVFVMPNFNYCDDGESYCFFDQTLPRLYTDSYCCHPDNLFVNSDIDEDGVNEIGIFYSSCVSRYKSLRIYSLKHNSWKEIGVSTFDIMTKDPTKVKFNELVRKISKNKFQLCNFSEGKTNWETITMK